jgi:hypothetical protein
MTRHQLWTFGRPLVAVIVAILAFVVAVVVLGCCFSDGSGGKGPSDREFFIIAAIFLPLLFLGVRIFRLRWWDALLPLIIPVFIVGADPFGFGLGFVEYWGARVLISVGSPIVLSAAFAALLPVRGTKSNKNAR